MRCRHCRHPAGWFRRTCRTCAALWAVFTGSRGAPLHALLPLFEATGAGREQIVRFLAADADGQGSIQDRIAAEMANQLFGAFGGTGGDQTAEQVARLRARGAWRAYGERPE